VRVTNPWSWYSERDVWEREQQRIFDKFYRLDPDQRRGIGGSGLGLYICQELVRSMNGRIHVESDPGEGAVFTFELPVAERITTTSAV
jgi:two-component system sensor histidine kinase BarA